MSEPRTALLLEVLGGRILRPRELADVVIQPRTGSVHGTAVGERQGRERRAPLLKLLLRRGPNPHPNEDAARRLLGTALSGGSVLDLEALVGVASVHADGGDGPARHRHGLVVGGVGEGRPRLLLAERDAGRRELQDRWHMKRRAADAHGHPPLQQHTLLGHSCFAGSSQA
eukprot:scaffold59778_cov60-Phaeocystis_antarctica.AAC.3